LPAQARPARGNQSYRSRERRRAGDDAAYPGAAVARRSGTGRAAARIPAPTGAVDAGTAGTGHSVVPYARAATGEADAGHTAGTPTRADQSAEATAMNTGRREPHFVDEEPTRPVRERPNQRHIGTILEREFGVRREQIEQALAVQREEGGRIGQILVRM